MRRILLPSSPEGLQALRERYERAEEDEGSETEDDEVSALISRGVRIADAEEDEDDYSSNDFHAATVRNDEVEHVLGYAKTGSDIPEGFWGIHWLDQYWSSSIAQDPGFRAQYPFRHLPSEETVVCFGDEPTRWNPATKSIQHMAAYGGERGHWTMKGGLNGRLQMQNGIMTRMDGEMQFLSPDLVKVNAAVKVPKLNAWLTVPDSMFQMLMHRKEWGWDRVTTVGPDLPNCIDHSEWLSEIMPTYFMKLVQSGERGAQHYPVLQIVDGDGNRTKYYDEYLNFVNGCASYQYFGLKGTAGCCTNCTVA